MPNKVELLYRQGRQGDVSTAGDSIGGCELDRERGISRSTAFSDSQGDPRLQRGRLPFDGRVGKLA